VQDEIAGLIAKNLQLKLGTIAPARVVDPEAYRLFLQGRAIFNREILEQYAKAIESYRASLAIDETSAEALAGLSKTYTISASSGMLTMEAGCELAHEAARRAIALDPNQAKGYASLGLVQLNYDWDWKGAADSLEQAVALAPGDVDTVGLMAHHAAITGQRERSLQLGRQAMELDPLNLSSGYARLRSLTNAGHFAELEKEAEHIIALNPSGFRSRMFLCLSRLLQGRADEAAAAAEQVPADWGRLTTLACARFAQGRKSESEANLIELVEKFGEHAIYQVAQVHAFRGEADQAFAWLEKAYRQRDSGMTLMKDDPVLKNLHGDDRWWPLLRKMKLADDQLT